MIPLTEHQLLIFWVQLAVLVAVARGLGGLMRRYDQPAVIGELAAGLIVGPSLLGRVAPDVYGWLFPTDPVQSGVLLGVAWVGVALLLVITGFETDLKLMVSLGRPAAYVSIGSLVVPVVVGVGLGWFLPDAFIGDDGRRLTFALFLGVALSISSLPVVAKILMEMNLMRRNVGQMILAAGMANDLAGWILLGMVAGIVAGGGIDLGGLAVTMGLLAVFLVAALTLGQRATDAALRKARQGEDPGLRSFTVLIAVTLFAAALTQAIGVEAVLGTFVAGIVLGRSQYQRADVVHSVEVVTNSFFAPVYFATAGLFVDLGLLFDAQTALWTLAVIVVATVTKVVGSSIGAKLGGMSGIEGLAVSVGLNARGIMGIVIATVGLSLAVLNQTSYTVIVVMSLVTSMTAPLLRRVLSRIEARPDETARLERESMLSESVIANAKTALLPTRGGVNSIVAARLLDLALQPDTSVTVYTVHRGEDDDARQKGEIAARQVRESFERHTTARIDRSADDAAAAICAEAELGYDLVALGMTESFTGGHALSSGLRRMLSDCSVPMLLVKHAEGVDPAVETLGMSRIVVPAVGTKVGQAAQEIAYTLAQRVDAQVQIVHVVNRPDKNDSRQSSEGGAGTSIDGMLAAAQSLALKFGRRADPVTRSGESVGRELVHVAEESDADLLVLGAQVRSYDGQPFLGHGVEFLLEHARQTLIVVVFPESN